MARNEEDREDLMREAIALFPRAELQVSQEPVPLFWGVKKSGHFSFYFGSDPVYQFDEHGALRRAYLEGALYRTQGETLARLIRSRSAEESVLNRTDLTVMERNLILQTMKDRFEQLQSAFADTAGVEFTKSLPEEGNSELRDQILSHIQLVLQHADQLAPRIRGKR